MLSGDDGSGWGRLLRLVKAYGPQLYKKECQDVTMADMKSFLDSKAMSYQSFDMPGHIDITECFTEGDEQGELLLDFLTQVGHVLPSLFRRLHIIF